MTFHISGMLWRENMLLRDLETGSLWSQLLGRCVEGEMHRQPLIMVPSQLTTWSDWKSQFPQSTVLNLSRATDEYTPDFYADRGRFLYGVLWQGAARGFSLAGLTRRPLLNDRVAETPLVIRFYPETGGATGWVRQVENRELVFILRAQRIYDRQTGSEWDLQQGIALDGHWKGTTLQRIPLIPTFEAAWQRFYPDATIWNESP